MLNSFQTLMLNSVAPSLYAKRDKPSGLGFNFMKKSINPENYIGKTFTRWTVLHYYGKSKSGNSLVTCKCVCGKTSNVSLSQLMRGQSKSCGCLSAELTRVRNSTHGLTRVGKHAPEHGVWSSMKRRCYKVDDNRYYRYGARGIIVCDRWLNSFENFISDMGRRPSPNHSLDRINNDGNYEPSNCRWSTDEQQRRNKSNNKWIEYNGERLILKDWITKIGVKRANFYYYKKRDNLTHEQTIDLCYKNNLK